MERFGVFVDAGYLFAAAGKLCFNTRDRRRLRLRPHHLCCALVELGEGHCRVEHFRSYWYDGAPDARPTPNHLDIAILPGVKLRLGKLLTWGQKGVDSRVVRDLIILAEQRAISTAYLMSGDEDLREGVAEAQERGVKVVLLAIEPLNEQNLSPSLAMEVDDIMTLGREFLSPHLELRRGVPVEEFEVAQTDDPRGLGHEVGTRWWERTPPVDRDIARRGRPRIPSELDNSLMHAARAVLGDALDDEDAKRAVRRGFWEAVDTLSAGSLGEP